MDRRHNPVRPRTVMVLWCLALSAAPQLGSLSAQSPTSDSAAFLPAHDVTTVNPLEIEDVLYNPGMGIADFHFGHGRTLSPEEYPRSTVAYFRWSWADLEPAEGAYNFDLVDQVVQQAKAKGETLAFRIMADYRRGSPQWLLDKGVESVKESDGIFPDQNNQIFLEYHEKLLRAFGARYGRSPDIDHVDIGSVGCWGEWNTACCHGVEAECQRFFPTEENQIRITDWYFTYFPGRPLVMLHGGQLRYAASRGAGWRGDCFGDYGYFGPRWNHMVDAYPPVLQDPVIADAWKRGPVQFEICGYMQDWVDLRFDLDLILRKGLEWHISVLNAKSFPIPAVWRARIEQFMKKMGYRFVLREFRHRSEARPGETVVLRSLWDNVGVAPMYHPRPLAYRLRSDDDRIVAQWTSQANLKHWLPGLPVELSETVSIPRDAPSGTYDLDVAILDEEGRSAAVFLAIAGGRDDRWYRVSQVKISE